MPRFQVNIVNSREKHFLKRTSLIQVAYFQRKQKVTFFDQIQVRDQNHGRIEDIASNRILVFAQKITGIATGQTLQVGRRKYMAKGCFDVQKTNFGKRSTLFLRSFIVNG